MQPSHNHEQTHHQHTQGGTVDRWQDSGSLITQMSTKPTMDLPVADLLFIEIINGVCLLQLKPH